MVLDTQFCDRLPVVGLLNFCTVLKANCDKLRREFTHATDLVNELPDSSRCVGFHYECGQVLPSGVLDDYTVNSVALENSVVWLDVTSAAPLTILNYTLDHLYYS